MNYFELNGYSPNLVKVGTTNGWGGYETYFSGVWPTNYVTQALPATIGNTYNISFGWVDFGNRSTAVKIEVTDYNGTSLGSVTFDETMSVSSWASANGYTTQSHSDSVSGTVPFVDFFKNLMATTVAFNVTLSKSDVGSTQVVYDYLLYSSPQPIPRPATINSAVIGPAGKTITLFVGDLSGNSSYLTAIATNPTISVNGGSAIPLANPIWSDGSADAILAYVVYLISPVSPTDSVTVSTVDSWATCRAGLLGPMTAFPATHAVGTLLPTFKANRKTMRAGFNVNNQGSGGPLVLYSNLARQSGPWSGNVTLRSNGLPSAVTSGALSFSYVVTARQNPDGSNRGYYSAPTGTYTVRWDSTTKDYIFWLVSASTATVSNPVISTLPDGRMQVQQVVSMSDPSGPSLMAAVTKPANMFDPTNPVGRADSYAIDATLLEIYPPGVDLNNPTLFHPETVKKVSTAKCLRFMDAIATSSSNYAEFSDFPDADPTLYLSGASWLTVSKTITSLSPYDNADAYYDIPNFGYVPIVIGFSAPHGFKEGQVAYIGGLTGPNADGSFPLTGGHYTKAYDTHQVGDPVGPGNKTSLNGQTVVIHVKSATEIVHGATGVYGTVEMTLDGTFSSGLGANASVYNNIKYGLPPGDCVALCNAGGADVWINPPHAATDALSLTMFDMIARTLNPGLKCYVEYSNETWNTSAAFLQSYYCEAQGYVISHGTGLTMTYAIDGSGHVVPTITSGGQYYNNGAPITFTGGTLISGGAANGWVQCGPGGVVTGIYLDNPGHYSGAPTGYTRFGTGLTLGTITINANGQVQNPPITSGGVGYRIPLSITFTGGTLIDGDPATASMTQVDGVVTQIIVQGFGHYSAAPTGISLATLVWNLDEWYSWRTAQHHKLARAAFVAAGRSADDVKRVLAGQGGWAGRNADRVGTSVACGLDFDYLAVAPYFWSGPNINALGAIYDTIDQDQSMDLAESYLGLSGIVANTGMLNNQAVLDGLYPSAKLVCYEGGPEDGCLTTAYPSDPTHVELCAHRSRAWVRDPRMRGIMFRYLQILQDSGCVLFNDYLLAAEVRHIIYGGDAQWGCYTRWNQPGGMGDGSDGLFDNRTDVDDLGNIVSVVGGAIAHWNTLLRPKSSARHGRGRQFMRSR